MHAHSIVPRRNNTPCVRQYEPRTQRVERVSPLLARKRVYKSYKRCTSSFLQSGSRSPLNYRFERLETVLHGFVPIADDDSLHPSHPRIGIVYRSGVTRFRQTSEFFVIKLIDYYWLLFCLCVFLELRYRIISLRFGHFSCCTWSSPAP